eukprot:290213_1
MASENCKPTAKCLGIATLVIVGLLFFYNVALKATSPNFDVKLNKHGLVQVTLTNIGKFPEFDEENATGFDIVLTPKAKKDDKGGKSVTKSIYIARKDQQQEKSVVFDSMSLFVGGSVTVTYFPEDKGFESFTKKVPTESKSKSKNKNHDQGGQNENYREQDIQSQQDDDVPYVNIDGSKPQPKNDDK